jgi:hypothetical protein
MTLAGFGPDRRKAVRVPGRGATDAMRALRGLIGPLCLGLSVWCAAGTIAVASPDQATPRFAVAAPIWILIAAAALAALVPAFRRRPGTAVPALLSTAAWWPLPLPPILLIFTGPLAWLPIAASVGLAIGSAPLAAIGRATGADRPTRAPWLAAAATLGLVAATAWSAAPRSPGGDEPHYLIITQSLLEDGDLRIENNHRQRDYAPYFGGELAPHYLVRGKNGQIYSVHAPGLPTIVLPGFALFGYRGAEATVMLLAALTGALIWRIGWRATRDARAAWFAWGAIATATTFLILGFTIYPDGPAMVAVAAAVLLLLRLSDPVSPPGVWALACASLPLSALPWLHTRFVLIAAGFGVLIAARVIADRARPIGLRLGRLAAFAAIPLASAVGWFAFFYVIYGTPNPAAAYGSAADTHLKYSPAGLVALLFDGQFGVLTYAPVLIASLVGWLRPVDRTSRQVGLEALTVMALYLPAATTYWMWWAGNPAPPARFFGAMLPALALPLAAAWTKGDALRRAGLVALGSVSLGFSASAIGVDRGRLAWNDRDAQSLLLGWLGPVVNLRRGWPSFFWTLDPGFSLANLSSEWIFAGRVALFLGVWTGAWFAVRALWARRPETTASFRTRAMTVTWLLIGVMLVVQAGWLANGVAGLDAEPAQAALLTAARRGRAVVGIDVLHVSRLPRFGGLLTMASEEPGRPLDRTPWFIASGLPAGEYAVTLRMDRAQAGAVTVSVGSVAQVQAVWPALEQTWPLRLSADSSRVVIVPDEALTGTGGRILVSATWGVR